MQKRKIGLALGSGSARGWSHIGVIRALQERGVEPDIVTGTSAGALVGALYASGELDAFEKWIMQLEWKDVLGFLDLSFGSGIMKGQKLFNYLREHFKEQRIEDFSVPFAAVATEIDTGVEVWIQEGNALEAIRASLSLPGILSPVYKEGKWLVDGGLVNPVPVSICRAMGAEVIIAVDLNHDLLLHKNNQEEKKTQERELRSLKENKNSIFDEARKYITSQFWGKEMRDEVRKEKTVEPSILEVVNKSISIMQLRITRSRMAGDPPDILLCPRLGHLGLMEYHRAEEAIAEGTRVVKKAEYLLQDILG
ncbi:MAG: patatin-like phospholipase RssA [Spirochaetota bacterium]